MIPARISSFASRASRIVAIGRRVLAKAHADALGLRSSALAFTTLLAIVPLLGVVSFFLAETLRQDDRTMRLVAALLPYPEEQVVAALESFVRQAATVRGVGLAGFLGISLVAFLEFENTVQRIFMAPVSPRIGRRLIAFALSVFWGPLVIGAVYSLLLYFWQHPRIGPQLRGSAYVTLAPMLIVWFALAMLFWLVPFRRVRLRNAALGAGVAALLLLILQSVFRSYVAYLGSVSRLVYGGFAIALFFVISIEAAWWIVLVGCETAALLELGIAGGEAPVPWPPEAKPWLALGALALLAERAENGKAPTPAPLLRESLGATEEELDLALGPAMDLGWVAAPIGDLDTFRLVVPAGSIRLGSIFEAHDELFADRLAHRPEALAERLRDLPPRLRRARAEALGEATLADLVTPAQADSA